MTRISRKVALYEVLVELVALAGALQSPWLPSTRSRWW